MSDKKLLNKTIQISAKEEKLQGGKPVCKIKDERGLTYTVYKTKQDGSISVAWEQLQKLEMGQNVFIGYVEDYGEYQGKKVTYRTIRNFDTDIANGVQNSLDQGRDPYKAKTSNSGQNNASDRLSNEEFGRRLAVHGLVNGMLANENMIGASQVTDNSIQWLVRTAIQIEDEINKQLNPSKFRQTVQRTAPRVIDEDLPTIQQDDPLPDEEVEGIPF